MINNGRFNILPTSGNAALGTGSPWDLVPGQIGFFSPVSNTAITTKAEADKDGFYIAVGIDTTGDGNTNNIRRSYRTIFPKDFVAFTQKCYQEFVPKIIRITDAVIEFDTDYLVKLNLENPVLNNVDNNMDYIVEFLSYTTERQVGSATSPDIEAMYQSFLDQAANNTKINDFVTLELLDPASGTVIPDLTAWVAANAGDAPDMRFTINKPILKPVMNALYNYNNPREIDVNVYCTKGFESNATVTIVQEMLYESMNTEEIQELERVAGGWDGNPGINRVIAAGQKEINYLSVKGENYNLLSLHYRYVSESAKIYENDMYVMIAIPDTASPVTAPAVVAMLGTLLTDSTTGLEATSC